MLRIASQCVRFTGIRLHMYAHITSSSIADEGIVCLRACTRAPQELYILPLLESDFLNIPFNPSSSYMRIAHIFGLFCCLAHYPPSHPLTMILHLGFLLCRGSTVGGRRSAQAWTILSRTSHNFMRSLCSRRSTTTYAFSSLPILSTF